MTTRVASGSEIAVLAVAGRFPGAKDVDELWNLLAAGREAVTFFSEAELERAGIGADVLRGGDYVAARGVLADIEAFDAEFFRLSPRAAALMDPQHRIFLECVWEALERAAVDPARVGKVGVYGGSAFSTYLFSILGKVGHESAQALQGNLGDFLTTRASYLFDLRGPSVNVQTACSTSLVAVHLACQSLLNGECDVAVAGGVRIHVPQTQGYRYERDFILSKDGHCRPFDANASGIVSGNGAGVAVLKRLEDAKRDGDPILAVILGSAVNNDGRMKVGFTAPSVSGQEEVIRDALTVAGVEPSSVQYIEAHGTGTALGDPIEVTALANVYSRGRSAGQACGIGSIKSNVGHLDAAAGIAGFIKVVLAMRAKTIPPSINVATVNPALGLDGSQLYVSTTLSPWPGGTTPRRAAVSSFGIGGTNAHMVLEEAPQDARPAATAPGVELLLLSAKTPAALDQACLRLAAFLEQSPGVALEDVACTLQSGRHEFPERWSGLADSTRGAIEALRGQRGTSVRVVRRPTVVFMFPGQGSQYPGMAEDLYRSDTFFKQDVDECCALFDRLLPQPLLPLIFPDAEQSSSAASTLSESQFVQPALFAIEYSLSRALVRWGIKPNAVIGHSLGEYAAATTAGVFSLEGAVSAIAARGRLMQSMPRGAMLSIPLPIDQVLRHMDGSLDVAAVNAPSLTVVSGREEAIDRLSTRLEAGGVQSRKLRVSHANHSSLMDPVIAPLRAALASVTLTPCKLPIVSSTIAGWMDRDATDPDYWAQQARSTVRFSDALAILTQLDNPLVVEVGPGTTLSGFARLQGLHSVPLLASRAGREKPSAILSALGELWSRGVSVSWEAHRTRMGRRIILPTYPFQKARHWIDGVHSSHRDSTADEGLPAVAREAPGSPSSGGLPATTEAVLAQLWSSLLGVQKLGAGADFFELGGDSLLGTQLMTSIRGRFGVDLPLRKLIESPRLSALAREIDLARVPVHATGPESRPTGLVRLRASDKGDAIVCLYPVSGSVAGYLPLTRRFSVDRACYGLEAEGLQGGGHRPLTTIPEIAAQYARALAVLPNAKNSILLGWSFGGIVAVELAMQLRAVGLEPRVFLLDAPSPGYYRRAGALESIAARIMEGSWEAISHFATAVEMDVERLFTPGGPQAALERMREPRFRDATAALARSMGTTADFLVARIEVFVANIQAARSYQPAPVAFGATLIRARDEARLAEFTTPDAWSEWLLGDLEVAEVDGDHYSFLESAAVAVERFIDRTGR